MKRPSVDVPHAVDGPGQVDDLGRGQDLAGAGLAAQARRHVQRAASVPALDGDGLAGIEADPNHQGQRGVVEGLVDEALLEIHGRPDGLPGRGEHGQGLVAAQLDHRAAAALHPVPSQIGELLRQLRRGLVASLLGEQRVATDVGDQERPDLCLRRSPVARPGLVGHRPP